MEYIKLKDSLKSLSDNVGTYSRNKYNQYLEQMRLLLNNTNNGYNELVGQMKLILQDLYNMLNTFTDESVNEISSEPHSLTDYINSKLCIIEVKCK